MKRAEIMAIARTQTNDTRLLQYPRGARQASEATRRETAATTPETD